MMGLYWVILIRLRTLSFVQISLVPSVIWRLFHGGGNVETWSWKKGCPSLFIGRSHQHLTAYHCNDSTSIWVPYAFWHLLQSLHGTAPIGRLCTRFDTEMVHNGMVPQRTLNLNARPGGQWNLLPWSETSKQQSEHHRHCCCFASSCAAFNASPLPTPTIPALQSIRLSTVTLRTVTIIQLQMLGKFCSVPSSLPLKCELGLPIFSPQYWVHRVLRCLALPFLILLLAPHRKQSKPSVRFDYKLEELMHLQLTGNASARSISFKDSRSRQAQMLLMHRAWVGAIPTRQFQTFCKALGHVGLKKMKAMSIRTAFDACRCAGGTCKIWNLFSFVPNFSVRQMHCKYLLLLSQIVSTEVEHGQWKGSRTNVTTHTW